MYEAKIVDEIWKALNTLPKIRHHNCAMISNYREL